LRLIFDCLFLAECWFQAPFNTHPLFLAGIPPTPMPPGAVRGSDGLLVFVTLAFHFTLVSVTPSAHSISIVLLDLCVHAVYLLLTVPLITFSLQIIPPSASNVLLLGEVNACFGHCFNDISTAPDHQVTLIGNVLM